MINSGKITTYAADDGIRGKDYLVIKGRTITINAGGDALKSDNDEDTGKGYILIEDGEFTITCDADGLDAETDALIMGGTFNEKTGGGSNVARCDNSAKGVKGNKWVVIDDGTFNINASDDAIHSHTSLVINDGIYTISTGDDAVDGDSSAVCNAGSLEIDKCVEGLESNLIAVNGGNISVIASDDCVNSTAGTRTETDDKSCTYIWRPYRSKHN